jgi:hypothetical protein
LVQEAQPTRPASHETLSCSQSSTYNEGWKAIIFFADLQVTWKRVRNYTVLKSQINISVCLFAITEAPYLKDRKAASTHHSITRVHIFSHFMY